MFAWVWTVERARDLATPLPVGPLPSGGLLETGRLRRALKVVVFVLQLEDPLLETLLMGVSIGSGP